MKLLKRTVAIVLALLTIASISTSAVAAKSDNGAYSITWVYEDRTVVDWYDEGETIIVREAILADGSTGGWSTSNDAEKAPLPSPVPETMPAENLMFYAKKSAVSGVIDHVIGQVEDIVRILTKEYWKERLPVLWVFPYVWYNLVAFFARLFG